MSKDADDILKELEGAKKIDVMETIEMAAEEAIEKVVEENISGMGLQAVLGFYSDSDIKDVVPVGGGKKSPYDAKGFGWYEEAHVGPNENLEAVCSACGEVLHHDINEFFRGTVPMPKHDCPGPTPEDAARDLERAKEEARALLEKEE